MDKTAEADNRVAAVDMLVLVADMPVEVGRWDHIQEELLRRK